MEVNNPGKGAGRINSPIPSVEEQEKIAARVEALMAYVDELLNAGMLSDFAAEQVRQIILTKAFGGDALKWYGEEPANVLVKRVLGDIGNRDSS